MIRKLLHISTAHLPRRLGEGGLLDVPHVYAGRIESGLLMWVPNDPRESSEVMVPQLPAEVLAVQVYARGQDCDYVLFDCDADVVDKLRTWPWL